MVWLPFDWKRHSMLTPLIASSILSRPSLPQPRAGGLMTPSRKIDSFVGFGTLLLSMNNQVAKQVECSFDEQSLTYMSTSIILLVR
jgi:hypothetical protein